MKDKIKVLIVDDSLVFREVLARGISADPAIEVVAKAVDPYDARDKIIEFRPDVMTCDVQMPKMNGIDFIKKLLPQYSIPVIVISTVSESVLDALDAGAVEFITKPDVTVSKNLDSFIGELIYKIKISAKAKVPLKTPTAAAPNPSVNMAAHSNKIIAIGASTGGTEAIYSVLKALPSTTPGIVIVQHIPPVFSNMFAQRLDNQTDLNVKEAQTGDYVERGTVLIAPGDRHMKLVKVGPRYKVECFEGAKVNGHCPSVDVLFDSVAKSAGDNAVGVILTGMGYDGAKGLLAMRARGARTIGQDEKSSVVYGMPKSAFEIGAVEKQVSLEAVPKAIFAMLNR